MKTFFTDPTVLWTIVSVTILLVLFYCLLLYRPAVNISTQCDDDHLKLRMAIDAVQKPSELDNVHIQIKKFIDRYGAHIPKQRMDRLINELCWNMRDKENELKLFGSKQK